MLMEPVKDEVFQKEVKIKFNNIIDGIDKYKNGILKGNKELDVSIIEDQIIEFLKDAFELNGENNAYIDFYYYKLNKEDKEKLENFLSEEDKKFLNDIKCYHCETIYFKLSKEIIPFIGRLSTREILFSTLYFTKIPCTIWGNYDMNFPCFFQDDLSMNVYKELSNKYSLKIN